MKYNIRKQDDNEWIERFVEEENNKNNQKRDILLNDYYFEWLKKMPIHPIFVDNIQYNQDNLTNEDIDNINKLPLLLDIIDSYAQLNGIDSMELEEDMLSYNFRYYESGFEIGVIIGQGSDVFCDKKAIDSEEDFINIEDIRANASSIIKDIQVLKRKKDK